MQGNSHGDEGGMGGEREGVEQIPRSRERRVRMAVRD